MNIFILDTDPKLAAQYHVDMHVGKMILESAQMLCTCLNLKKGKQVAPYKTAHPNHPCTIWVMESKANFIWLCELARELHEEFKYRRGKSHKSFEVVKYCLSEVDKIKFHNSKLTPFAQAMNEEYRNEDAVKAYREYYNKEKSHLHKWTKRKHPYWID